MKYDKCQTKECYMLFVRTTEMDYIYSSESDEMMMKML